MSGESGVYFENELAATKPTFFLSTIEKVEDWGFSIYIQSSRRGIPRYITRSLTHSQQSQQHNFFAVPATALRTGLTSPISPVSGGFLSTSNEPHSLSHRDIINHRMVVYKTQAPHRINHASSSSNSRNISINVNITQVLLLNQSYWLIHHTYT